VAVAAGGDHSLALKSDGTVVSWGDNEYGQSTVPTGLSGVVAVAAGGDHSLALKSDGTVVSWGDNEYGQSTVPTGLSGVVAVAAGGDHSLALKSDGTVAAWGSNGLGESTVPAGLSGVVAVAAGEDHDLAIVGQPQGLAVVPDGATVFGSIQVGSGAERGFTVSNPGDSTLSGTASVSEPFSVIAGASYTLGPGRSQTVTVRYSPTVPGTDSGYVTFTGGGLTLTRQVIGSAFNDPTPLTGAIAGRVTSSGQPISGATITVIVPGANLFGPGAISGQAGSYLVTGLAPHAHYEVMAAPPMGQLQQFYMADVANVAVTAGQTTTVNIELTPVNNQPPAPTAQNTPVILVRGWGPDTPWHDNDPNSEWGYWSALRSALRGFENVWDCNQPDNDQDFPVYNGLGGVINGENGIGDNARSLEYFVQQKALQFKRVHHSFPQSINIVAHSMGGLIAREAISLTGAGVFTVYDPADQEISTIKVNKVVMLGTPNAGSVLADAGEYFLGGLPFWLPSWTSTKNLRTDFVQSCFNAIYNSFPSSVSLYLVGGGGGPSSANDLYAAYSRFMNVQNAPLPPEQVTDGMVTWPSLQGTFYKRTLPTFEVQQFVSVPLYPAAPPKFFSLLDHSELKSDLLAVDWVIARLTDAAEPSVVSPSIAGDVGGPRAKSPRPLDLTQDPPIEQFELATGTLGLGATAKNVVICDAATAVQFQMIADDTNAMLRLNTPSGAEISPATPQTNTNVQYSAVASTSGVVVATYKVSNPAHGAWTAVIDDSGVTSTQATYGLMVFGDSSVAMVPQTGSVFNEGQDAVISCALVDLSTHPPTPVSSASMGATILFPDGSTNRLVLLDDGAHNDGALGDGVFAAVLAGVQQPGQYSISYRALGTNSQGQALQRVAAGAFTVSSGHGSLWGDPVYQSLDTDGDGIADFLEVKCWVNLTAPGNYILAGDLVDDSGAHRFSQSAAFAVDASGPSMATLIFNLAEMRVAGGQGTYHIENLQLFEATSTGIAWVDAYHGSSVVNIQAAKAINVSPQNLATNVSPAVELRWADGGASSSYDVYFGTNAPGLSLKTNQTSTTYGPGILAYNTAYYWRVDARNAAGVTTGDVWTFATVPAAVQGAGLGVRTNCFGFTIAGSSNLVIVVEACTNLAKPIWSPVGTNTLSGGLSYFRDPQWTNYPSRFYRLRSP
jgi:pimeloyl-ACP methyl ester carboxylesterase